MMRLERHPAHGAPESTDSSAAIMTDVQQCGTSKELGNKMVSVYKSGRSWLSSSLEYRCHRE